MDLNALIEELETKINRYDLSDDYLYEHKHPTRDEISVSEYAYGISMVPCSWVYPYLIKLKQLLEEREKVNNEKDNSI